MSDVPTNANAGKSAERYHILMPAWGDAYAQKLIDFGLPCLLSPGNLPALPTQATFVQIFTLSSDAETIKRSAVYQKLENTVSTSIELIDDVDMTNHYLAMTECYNRGLAYSEEIDTAFIFLTADSVWSDGSFRRMDELQRMGKRAIMVTGLSLEESTGIAALQSEYLSADRTQITITGREFVKLALDYLNLLSIAHFVIDDHALAAEHLYWDLGSDGLLLRCFHMHPMMVRPTQRDARIDVTIDIDYMEKTCPNHDDVYVVTDSDEICCCEFSPSATREANVSLTRLDTSSIAAWSRAQANAWHRSFAKAPICYHATEITERWQPVIEESNRFVDDILRLAAQPGKPMLKERAGFLKSLYLFFFSIARWIYHRSPVYYHFAGISETVRCQNGQILLLQRRLELLKRRVHEQPTNVVSAETQTSEQVRSDTIDVA